MALDFHIHDRQCSFLKPKIDQYLDPALLRLAVNGSVFWAGDRTLDYISEQGSGNGWLVLGTYGLLGVGLLAANKAVSFVNRKISNAHQQTIKSGAGIPARRSWLRTGAQILGITAAGYFGSIRTTIDNYVGDANRIAAALSREEPEEPEQQLQFPPPLEKIVKEEGIDPHQVIETSKILMQGRYLRTVRWATIIEGAEKKYGIEQGLLAGLIMRESYGDPLELNASDDGGAGLMMFQPGTARSVGLKVYGNSHRTGRDRNHGAKLRDLKMRHHSNYGVLANLDERFDVEKSVYAGARYLSDQKKRFETWNKALSAYNRGTPAKNPAKTSHVQFTRKYQQYYLARHPDR